MIGNGYICTSCKKLRAELERTEAVVEAARRVSRDALNSLPDTHIHLEHAIRHLETALAALDAPPEGGG